MSSEFFDDSFCGGGSPVATCGFCGVTHYNDLRQILKFTKEFRYFEGDDEGLQRHLTK